MYHAFFWTQPALFGPRRKKTDFRAFERTQLAVANVRERERERRKERASERARARGGENEERERVTHEESHEKSIQLRAVPCMATNSAFLYCVYLQRLPCLQYIQYSRRWYSLPTSTWLHLRRSPTGRRASLSISEVSSGHVISSSKYLWA